MSHYKLLMEHAPQTEWSSWSFLLELSCGALGGGLFLAGSMVGSIPFCLAGFLLATACKGLLLLKDLGRPERFLRVMLRPLASWLSVGAWVLMFFGFFGMLHLALLLAPSLGSSPWVRIPAMIFALALITYDGLLLSASRGIAAWGSGLLAPLFAANALAAGCAVVLPGYSGSPLLWANFGFLLAELVILLCHLAALQGGSTGARAAGTVLLRGEQKFLFLGGTLFAGMVLPLLLLATQLSAPGPTDIVLGLNALLNVAGLCCMRISLLKSGVTTPAL